MKKNKHLEYYILAFIVIIGILFRLYYAFQSPAYDNDISYYIIHQVENIQENHVPLYSDDLSYSGRNNLFSPGYYYILSLISLFIPKLLVFKIIPNIFASLSSVLVFFIVKKLTRNTVVSLFSSFISLFIPIFLISTTNTISPSSLTIPLILLSLFLFMKIEKNNEKYLIGYIIAIWLLALVSANVFIVILSLMAYMVLTKTEDIELSKAKKEVIIFSIFSALWLQFIIYKKALLVHGPEVIWQNIPNEFIMNYFSNINIFLIIYSIGIIPFFFGLYIIHKYTFKIKNPDISLFISLTLITTLLLLFRLIKLNFGMTLFGFCFVLFFGMFYKELLLYIEKTKFHNLKFYVIIALIFIFFLTSVFPSASLLSSREQINQETIHALEWIGNNTKPDSTILGTVDEGSLITSIANRKNIIDNNFLLINDINERTNDIKTIFTSSIATIAVELLDYYDIDYILIDDAKQKYGIQDLRYNDSKCLELIYEKEIKIYKIICKIEKNE